MVHKIIHNGELLGLIVPHNFREPGIYFFTPDKFSQQLGYMCHPQGKVIQPHIHNPLPREVLYTQEVLFIKKGKLRVDFYDTRQNFLESYLLQAGDVILLAAGGHGLEILEEAEIIEVKQGPYVGDHDKTCFPGITLSRIQPEE
ncbi:MAG: hypothetical protein D4R73_08995 [Deltaproteobacteria bacterium]|nr:MAG: hypothetical protein D4R73_08995 [Deltaproteobacteria bacterium]